MPENKKDSFFDHFGEDKPTKLGNWLVSSTQKQIFDFAQIQQGCSVLEIGPGRGVFVDICLSNGVEYWAIEPNAKMAEAVDMLVQVNFLRESLVENAEVFSRKFDGQEQLKQITSIYEKLCP